MKPISPSINMPIKDSASIYKPDESSESSVSVLWDEFRKLVELGYLKDQELEEFENLEGKKKTLVTFTVTDKGKAVFGYFLR